VVEITVHTGDGARHTALITVPVPEAQVAALMGTGPVSGQLEPTECVVRLEPGGQTLPAQYDPVAGELAFLLAGKASDGMTLRFTLERGRANAQFPVSVIQKLDRAVFVVNGEPFATYTVLGARRPYFWPVIGPSGASVVRGQGTSDHPHHTGMGLAYGGHSEGGSVNIWSDWDEPPYGPGGRMVHRGFRRVVSGPVYGELVQDLIYLDTYGEPFAEEVRTVRCWWASPQERFLDLRSEVLSARDRGTQPFVWAIRLPSFFDIPETGHVTNGAGHPVPAPKGQPSQYRAPWVDASGPTGGPPAGPPIAPPEVLVDQPGYEKPREGPGQGPWNGIALFDHPENEGYPNVVGKYAGGRGMVQLTHAHYAPASAPTGPFTFRQRVYVHDGDAEQAGVAARQAEYAQPCRVGTD